MSDSLRVCQANFHIVKANFLKIGRNISELLHDVHGLTGPFPTCERSASLPGHFPARVTSATMASWAGVGTPIRRPSAAMPPLSTAISVVRRASTSCSIEGLWAYASADRLLDRLARITGERDARPGRRRLRLLDQALDLDSQARIGAHLAHGEPGERGERAGRGVEHDFRPLRATSVRDRDGWSGRPRRAARPAGRSRPAGPGSARTARSRCRRGRRSGPCRAGDCAGGDDRAADDPGDQFGDRLLVADPVLHARHGGVRQRFASAVDRFPGVLRLGRDDAEVAVRQVGGVGAARAPARRSRPARSLSGRGERSRSCARPTDRPPRPRRPGPG